MKFLTLIICFFNLTVFAQKIDWVNAPANPIVLKYKLEHFNLKGDVFNYDFKYYFNKEGFLVSKSDYQGDNTYTYKNGKLESDGTSLELKVNEQGYLTFKKTKNNIYDYIYNFSGLITSSSDTRINELGKTLEMEITGYEYDAQNRVIKEETFFSKDSKSKKTITYSYKKLGNTLQVIATITEPNREPYVNEKHYIDGRLVWSKSSLDSIVLKIESKFDAKGNSIEDKYINNGALTDTFNYSILYYSDTNKPINYKIVLEKGFGTLLNPSIFRNGIYFYSPFKVKLDNSNDLLFYDDLTQNYYIGKNAYLSNEPIGTEIKLDLIAKHSEALLYNLQDSKAIIYYQGRNIFLSSKPSSPSFLLDHLFSYHIDKYNSKERTFFFKDAKGKTFVSGELLPHNKDQFYYYADGKTNTDLIVLKGVFISKSTFSKYEKIGDYDLLGYLKGIPTYVFPDYFKMEKDKIYSARIYDSKIDNIKVNTSTNSTNQNSNSISSTISGAKCTSGNCDNGFGVQEKNDFIIESFFTNGQANGYGYLRYKTAGDYYYGTFKDGLREGFGMYTWKSTGVYYIGQWKAGNMHGYGYLKKDKDITQAGYYENGKQLRNMLTQAYINQQWNGNCVGDCDNGFGYYKYNDGSYYVGFYANKTPSYIGAYVFKDGSSYIGEWLQGKRTGQGIESYTNDSSYRGVFVDGKRQGLGVYVDKNEKVISKGLWENGILKNPIDSHNLNTREGLSKEASDFLSMYRTNSANLKQHLKQLEDSWVQNTYPKDMKTQKYADLIEEIYKNEKDAAFEFTMKMSSAVDIQGLMPLLEQEIRDFIKVKAREKVQTYSDSKN
jgi:hypothetical protein